MNEKFAMEILEILKSTKDFVFEQVPDVARQLVMYERVEAPLIALMCALVLIGIVRFWTIAPKKFKAGDWDDDWLPVVAFMTLIFGSLFFCSFVDFTGAAIKVWVAPKLYLLEYLSSLVKSGGH